MEITSSDLQFHIRLDESSGWKLNAAVEKTDAGTELLSIELHRDVPAIPPQTEISWTIPQLDIQTRWNPAATLFKNVPPDWCSTVTTNLA
ncbi:MAG: hypothetical protein J6S73_07235, partial [Lentisphaeria bacterium]|nr:hypothetical protein [Lentisphaeria bacterium]